MIEQISSFFNIEMIYLWLNFGVLPFWITLIFFPQSRTCSYLVTSVFPFFLLSLIYSYLLYLFFMNGYDFSNNFSLYLSLENLSTLFTENDTHFVFGCYRTIFYIKINWILICWNILLIFKSYFYDVNVT